MRTKSFLVTIFALIAYSVGAFAGAGSSGGDDGLRAEKTKINYWIYNDHLKHAMLDWLAYYKAGGYDAIVPNDPDRGSKEILASFLASGNLQSDIQAPHNFVNEEDCQDAGNLKKLESADDDNASTSAKTADLYASTKIGVLRGQICFNVEKLAKDYINLSDEEQIVRLGAVAFHEIFHQLQYAQVAIEKNEAEAYQVANFIETHATGFKDISMKWQDPNAKKCDTQAEARAQGWVTALRLCTSVAARKYCENLVTQKIGFNRSTDLVDGNGNETHRYPIIETVGDWKKILMSTYVAPIAAQEPLVMMMLQPELPYFYKEAGLTNAKDADLVDDVFTCKN